MNVGRNDDLTNRFSNLDQLRGTGSGMDLQLAAFGSVVRFVVMPHVAQEQAADTAVGDDAEVAADSHGPEVLVLGLIEPM